MTQFFSQMPIVSLAFTFLAVAFIVTVSSIKASQYVDNIDKKTNLSGAFIGGVMLSAVTSLPELFTSISAVLMINSPGLCIGNILGSDLFNIAALSVLFLFAYKSFSKVNVAKSHIIVALIVICIYVFLVLNWLNILNINIFTLSLTSILILVLYAASVKFLASDDSESEGDDTGMDLPLNQTVFRFILVSILIVISSIVITYITDSLSVKLNLGSGLAGALFLGITTSLPELSSSIALIRMKNFNVAIGNIVGSNIFNFLILAIADGMCIDKNAQTNGIYNFADQKTLMLLLFGIIGMILFLFSLKIKNKAVRIICPLAVFACYVGFLLV